MGIESGTPQVPGFQESQVPRFSAEIHGINEQHCIRLYLSNLPSITLRRCSALDHVLEAGRLQQSSSERADSIITMVVSAHANDQHNS